MAITEDERCIHWSAVHRLISINVMYCLFKMTDSAIIPQWQPRVPVLFKHYTDVLFQCQLEPCTVGVQSSTFFIIQFFFWLVCFVLYRRLLAFIKNHQSWCDCDSALRMDHSCSFEMYLEERNKVDKCLAIFSCEKCQQALWFQNNRQ